MRYHLFLQYGWFYQNLGKDFIGTNMHTTVIKIIFDIKHELGKLQCQEFKVVPGAMSIQKIQQFPQITF